MKQRIFPFDQHTKSPTWNNYSNYLNWINEEIDSLVSYASYWQPTYQILNEPMSDITNIFNINEPVQQKSVEVPFYDLIVQYDFSSRLVNVERNPTHYYSSVHMKKVSSSLLNNFTIEYYKIWPNIVINVEYKQKGDFASYCFVDSNFNYISGSNAEGNGGKIITPPGAKYLILQSFSGSAENNFPSTVKDAEEKYKICFPNFLKYKQGVYNPYHNLYLCYDESYTFDSLGIVFDLNQKCYKMSYILFNEMLSINKLQLCPSSFVFFARKWIHKGTHMPPWSSESKDASHYFLMAQSFAPMFNISSQPQKLHFKCFSEGPGVLGSTIKFCIERTPSRYFINIDQQQWWDKGAKTWSLYNIDWSNEEKVLIASSKGLLWTNSYPIMPTIQAIDSDTVEDFIVDYKTTVSSHNIENHYTLAYNIITNEDGNYTKEWHNFISVLLI